MDNVSNFLSGLSGSLKSGAIRKCQFTVEFRMDVFRYPFRDRGTKPTRGLGKLYQKVDFSEQFFSEDLWMSEIAGNVFWLGVSVF